MKILKIPAFALFLGAVGIAMLLPALVASLEGEWKAGRSFLYGAIFTVFSAGAIGTLLSGAQLASRIRVELLTVAAAWLVIPIFAAIPLVLITPQIGATGAWFEMALSFTTTGGTVYVDPDTVDMSIHLWRGMIGWLGGLLTLTAAYVVMAPRRLGGFEVAASAAETQDRELGARLVDLGAATPDIDFRLKRAMRNILPVYIGMTIILMTLLGLLGQQGPVAAIHAMSVVSTSGITPLQDGFASQSSVLIELVVALFLVLAATRLIYARASQRGSVNHWYDDPELRLMGVLVAATTALLFLRHWFGALSVDVTESPAEVPAALWGAVFTTLSFLTTTGFESSSWQAAREWSGLPNPALILLALCAVGGGAATTAGGIKLIRAHALLRHGLRELDRIAQPNAIVGVGMGLRGVLRQGAFIAWAFIMLFVLSIFAVTAALTTSGLAFEDALVFAVAALTNTGPVATAVLGSEAGYSLLASFERIVLAGAMVLGRIETLGVIALFNPELWRSVIKLDRP